MGSKFPSHEGWMRFRGSCVCFQGVSICGFFPYFPDYHAPVDTLRTQWLLPIQHPSLPRHRQQETRPAAGPAGGLPTALVTGTTDVQIPQWKQTNFHTIKICVDWSKTTSMTEGSQTTYVLSWKLRHFH